MKRIIVGGMLVVVIVLLSIVSVFAQGDAEIYYVRQDHEGCEDGSEECPYNTLTEALDAGAVEVCEERTFEVWMWDASAGEYEYYDTYTGAKPLPGTGVPVALPLGILFVAIAGAALLYLAWRLRRQTAS